MQTLLSVEIPGSIITKQERERFRKGFPLEPFFMCELLLNYKPILLWEWSIFYLKYAHLSPPLSLCNFNTGSLYSRHFIYYDYSNQGNYLNYS